MILFAHVFLYIFFSLYCYTVTYKFSFLFYSAKDTKINDGTTDDIKNKSPKGSKSSIAKDSLV